MLYIRTFMSALAKFIASCMQLALYPGNIAFIYRRREVMLNA